MSIITTITLHPVNAGHFNSIGTEKQGKYDIAAVKRFEKDGNRIPYISPQAVRKYIRRYIEARMNEANYYQRVRRKTTKKDFVILDPVRFIEDDLLGFSHPLYKNPNKDAFGKRLLTASMNRRSPILTNGIIGVESGSSIHSSEGWVHTKVGTPLPYKAEFSTGFLQGTFAIELSRVGRFENYGDIIELDPALLKLHPELVAHKEADKTVYELAERSERVRLAIDLFFDSILNLYGGGKATMFADKLHPSIMVAAGVEVAAPLPCLFRADEAGEVHLDKGALRNYLAQWGAKLRTDLHIGYREGTLHRRYQEVIKEMDGMSIEGVRIRVTTPGGIRKMMMEEMG